MSTFKTRQRREPPLNPLTFPARSPAHDLLLRACFLPSPAAETALREWERATLLDDIEDGTHVLLPLLKHHADQAGWHLQEAARIGGVARHQWTRDTLKLQQARATLDALRAASVELLLVGDAALALTAYPRVGLRPIRRVSLLICPAQVALAMQTLTRAGWTAPGSIPVPRAPYLDRLDFHQADSTLSLYPAADEDRRWPRAIALHDDTVRHPLGGVSTLDPIDQLLFTGRYPDPTRPASWVADLATMVRASSFDWPTVWARAAQAACTARLLQGLRILQETLAIDLADAMAAAPRDAIHWVERLEIAAMTAPLPRWQAHALRYWRRHSALPLLAQPRALWRYAAAWNITLSPRRRARRLIERLGRQANA